MSLRLPPVLVSAQHPGEVVKPENSAQPQTSTRRTRETRDPPPPIPWPRLSFPFPLPGNAGRTQLPQLQVAREHHGEGAEQPRYHVADAHLHFVDFIQQTDGIQSLLRQMDQAGVDHMMLTGMGVIKKWDDEDRKRPVYYLDNDSRAYWYSTTDVLVARAYESLEPAQRTRFHPFICGFNAADKGAVDHVKRMLQWYPGVWQGIGEIFAKHDALSELTYGETPTADSASLDPVYQLAAVHDLPVTLHANITEAGSTEPLYIGEVDRAAEKHPNTRFIWAHAGISRNMNVPNITGEIERLLAKHPNLYVDLSWVVFDQCIAPDGRPQQAWVDLIEKFPDRFMIGSDLVGHFKTLPDTIHKYYALLDQLSPATAQRVAEDNFIHVLPARVQEEIAHAEQRRHPLQAVAGFAQVWRERAQQALNAFTQHHAPAT